MERTKWVERKFNFDFPAGLMPVILERLRGTSVRMNKIASALSDEQLRIRQEGKWSIQEHIGHLVDLEELHDGRIDDFIARKEVLRAADMNNAKTNAASHNDRKIEDILREFRDKRASLVSRLMKLDDSVQLSKSMHPRLQVKMRPVDMAYFTAEHDDHHLATVREIMMTF
jgi:uncharacterized damage-inducible protein DinB